MVKKIMKFFAYMVFFVVALLYFFPKVSLFYFLEQQLQPLDLIVSSEKLKDTGFILKVQDGVVSFKSIESAKIKEIEIGLFVLYNTIKIQDITLSSTASSFVPLKIEEGEIIYSVIDPLHVNARLQGEFGKLRASYNIVERSVELVLEPSKLMLNDYRATLRSFKKDEKGEYIYEKTF